MIKLDISKCRCSNNRSAAHIPVSYNGSTTDSDSVGSSSILLTGAMRYSVMVSAPGSNPGGVSSILDYRCQAIRSEIVCKSFYFIQ